MHSDALKAASDYEKRVEELLVNLDKNDNANRIVQYAYYAKKILRQYILCLQKQKAEVLSATMTECYRKLFHKKNFIKRIVLNAETLDFLYYNAHGEIVDGESLSAGEKQLMVIALLWALSICASKKFPVVIDAPLSRLDSNHRRMLLTAYFPQASDQTIILSTDSEIRLEDYQLIQSKIGDAYTIVYDDDKKSSSIQSGYFTGECHDNQTN